MSATGFVTSLVHHVLDPWQAATRKGRLRSHGMAPGAVPPVFAMNRAGCLCRDPGCALLVEDTLGFHAKNAPGRGVVGRYTARTAMVIDRSAYDGFAAYRSSVSKRTSGRSRARPGRPRAQGSPVARSAMAPMRAACGRSPRPGCSARAGRCWTRCLAARRTCPMPGRARCAGVPGALDHGVGAFAPDGDGERLIAHFSLRGWATWPACSKSCAMATISTQAR
jgi:hypothetical protein